MADKNITETVISLEKEVILLKRELKNILDLLKGGTAIPPKVSELSVRVLDKDGNCQSKDVLETPLQNVMVDKEYFKFKPEGKIFNLLTLSDKFEKQLKDIENKIKTL